MPTDNREAPGWYGKLPALGDFAQRRLPAAVVRACDAWLSSAVQGSRDLLGEGWLGVYLTAPVLRFGWAPGVIGMGGAGGMGNTGDGGDGGDAGWWFGVLMPSCDAVGRYFPLLVAQRRLRPPVDRVALDHLEAWFDRLALAAVGTLADGASLDAFEAALAAAPPWPTPGRSAVTSESAPTAGGGSRSGYRLAPHATLGDLLHGIAARDLQTRLAGTSLWWRQPGQQAPSSLTVLRGLPDGAAFAALLAGDV